MPKQRSTEPGKKLVAAKRTIGLIVSPERTGQTTQVYGPFNAGVVNERQKNLNATGGQFLGHGNGIGRVIANSYAKDALHIIPLHGKPPETAFILSSEGNSRKRAAVTTHTPKAAKVAVIAPRRDFGEVLELDHDKVQSLDADALDGYGARRAAFFIKKFATE